MLKTSCINPEIMSTLACCGHGDKILIADGNYPIESNTNTNTRKAYINLSHGIPTVTQVLNVLSNTITIEKAEVMAADDGQEPLIFQEFKKMLGTEAALYDLNRLKFYEECKKENVKLAIATGEQRLYANILLTIGVVN